MSEKLKGMYPGMNTTSQFFEVNKDDVLSCPNTIKELSRRDVIFKEAFENKEKLHLKIFIVDNGLIMEYNNKTRVFPLYENFELNDSDFEMLGKQIAKIMELK